MKRTISEVIDLIKQKKESAERTRRQIYADFINREMPMPREKRDRYERFVGYDEAYTDILALLESSHLIEQEKAIEILKKRLTINFGQKVYGDNSVIIREKIPSIDVYLVIFVTEEEKKILEDWLND